MAAPTNSAKINTMADGVTANAGDQIPVNRAGADAYITPTYIKTFVGAQPSNAILTSLAGLTFAVGDIVFATGAAALTNLADVATGNALLSGGVGVAPAWGKIGLTTHVSGILPSANGGTGVNNAGTITNASNTTITGGGTVALGGFSLTVPATGTAALLATANVFTVVQVIAIADAGTNTTTTLATLTHNSSGTPAASFGSRLLFNLDSATVDDRNAIAFDAIWVTATDASRKSAASFSTVTGGGALTEVLRIVDPPVLVTLQKQTSFAYSELTASSLWITGTSRLQLSCTDATNGVNITSGLLTAGTGNSANLVLRAGSTFSVQTLLSDAGTNTAPNVHAFRHNSSGTPAAGFGMTVQSQLQSSTTTDTVVADDTLTWVVATHASRTARRVHAIYDTAARETFREEASGAAPMIGFLGAAAVVRQTGGENLTNNVTSGGTTGQIDDFSDLTIFANSAAAIRNDIYQLARMLKQDHDALRLYGFLT